MVRRVIRKAPVDPAACPLCGGDNRCVKVSGEPGPCWCRSATFTFDLLARAGTGKACICERCLERHAGAPASGVYRPGGDSKGP